MDSAPFSDQYSSYSDSSAPRTPSPRTDEYHSSPYAHKSQLELDPFRHMQEPESQHHGEFWTGMNTGAPFTFHPSKGSLLHELYEEPESDSSRDQRPSSRGSYLGQSAEPSYGGSSDWQAAPGPAPPVHQNSYPRASGHSGEYMPRRATFPYVRHDREENHYPTSSPQPFLPEQRQQQQQQQHYDGHPDRSPHSHHLPMSAEPSAFHGGEYMSSPHGSYREFGSPGHDDRPVKVEDGSSPRVPPQQPYYRGPPSPPAQLMSHLSPYAGIVVQHTDDAASKETQYLRRRCFNCHTTEPPSWRRSTLNPGKIVCNKCGLYERTHLRPRPLRFDELRAGNKARKNSAKASPKAGKAALKKETNARGEYGIARRSSVSSTHSNNSSASGASDWDDNVSLYSSGSAPPSSFNSPSMTSFPLGHQQSSRSPPMTHDSRRRGMSDASGIRLPNAPFSDIASLHGPSKPLHVSHPPPSPRNYPSPPEYFRRSSVPDMRGMAGERRGSELSESGWQSVDMPARTEVAV